MSQLEGVGIAMALWITPAVLMWVVKAYFKVQGMNGCGLFGHVWYFHDYFGGCPRRKCKVCKRIETEVSDGVWMNIEEDGHV